MTETSLDQKRWLKHMSAGKNYFQQGRLQPAVQEFSQAVQLTPERVEGWINLGSALIESKRYDAAIDVLGKVLNANDKLMLVHLLLGDALRQQGHWAQSRASYQAAVALERTPLSLNKLACALRVEDKHDLAEGLYQEALDIAPDFTLARLNLATLQIELSRFEEAERQLSDLDNIPLAPAEQREKDSAQFCLAQYRRLRGPIAEMLNDNNPAALEAALRDSPREITQSDSAILKNLQVYADASQRVSVETSVPLQDIPDEWPMIEAMFMIPLASSVTDYRELKNQLETQTALEGELLVSANMEAPIRAAQACHADMADPVKAELQLRRWHAMSCDKLEGFLPGHFKYTQNWIPSNPAIKRAEPALASNTLRQFVSDIYPTVTPGYARAAVALLAISDIHPFADGNGRIALTWLNRELVWAGLMPAIFPYEISFSGELNLALRQVQEKSDDLSPIIAVILRGQHYAQDFCAELAAG